jgi:DUF1680 family protein
MLIDTRKSPYAKVHFGDANNFSWSEGFWNDVFKMCSDVTVPQQLSIFKDVDKSHVIENFKIAAGDTTGYHKGTPFGDGDFYKWIEAATYTAVGNNDKAMEEELDYYIELIGKAQKEDGYISTKQIIGQRVGKDDVSILGDINDFEMYNFGHLFTSACVYKRLTGKDNFLEIAIKAADFLEKMYHKAITTGDIKTAVCPSHYMGLIELYRTTKDKRYLNLAKLAIELRDRIKNGTDDNQDRVPLRKHDKIVGHAVRATYLYAGVTDLYAEIGDESLRPVLKDVWNNMIETKFYITGGCGALYNGASPYGDFFNHQLVHQAFGYEYQLPNVTAYNETCASLGAVFWALRMFSIDPQPKYYDVIERIMMNVALAAISLDGNKYFYQNMLRRTKELKFELIWPLQRESYLEVFCCPPNLARTLAQASEYMYAISDDTIWFGMYGANETIFHMENGSIFTLVQETNYPWDGLIKISFKNIKKDMGCRLKLRIPEWVENGFVKVSGLVVKEITRTDASTFVEVIINNLSEDTVELFFDMPVRYTVSNNMVEENINQVAIERGPLVYCIETPDASVDTIDDIFIKMGNTFELHTTEILGREIVELRGKGLKIRRLNYDRDALYQKLEVDGFEEIDINLIPYFAWDNRGFGEMKIWIPIIY